MISAGARQNQDKRWFCYFSDFETIILSPISKGAPGLSCFAAPNQRQVEDFSSIPGFPSLSLSLSNVLCDWIFNFNKYILFWFLFDGRYVKTLQEGFLKLCPTSKWNQFCTGVWILDEAICFEIDFQVVVNHSTREHRKCFMMLNHYSKMDNYLKPLRSQLSIALPPDGLI